MSNNEQCKRGDSCLTYKENIVATPFDLLTTSELGSIIGSWKLLEALEAARPMEARLSQMDHTSVTNSVLFD
jgi:hypothetical protein